MDKRLKGLKLPLPLRGNEPGSFAEDTLSRRLPGIARSLLKGDWHPQARTRLQALADEMPDGRLRPIWDAEAPDFDNWQTDILPYLGQTWLEAPWFVAEVYFFRRILEASGYFQPGPGQGVDPYRSQKVKGLSGVIEQLAALCAMPAMPGAEAGEEPLQDALVNLLYSVIWGNQADLSVWPVGGAQPERYAGGQRLAHLLADDAKPVVEFIINQPGGLSRVDFILDNVGLELAYDLLLADFLLNHGLAQQALFHAKPFPTYISDATTPDVSAFIEFLTQAEDPVVSSLGSRLRAYLQSGRLCLETSFFWTSPLPGWEMPPETRRQLAGADLLVSKGDANYRRWLGDRRWPFTTPIQQILAYRPAPLLMLRVLKSEIVAGLQPGQSEELCRLDPTWLFNGRWGIIQYIP